MAAGSAFAEAAGQMCFVLALAEAVVTTMKDLTRNLSRLAAEEGLHWQRAEALLLVWEQAVAQAALTA